LPCVWRRTERRKDSKEGGWVVDRTVKRAFLEDPWQDPAILRTLNQMQRAEDMPIARYTPSSTAADEDQASLHDDSFLPLSTTLLLSSRTRSSPSSVLLSVPRSCPSWSSQRRPKRETDRERKTNSTRRLQTD